jgi:hypothetical protein
MSEIFVPIVLTLAGAIAAFVAYRGIRRGGARFYTLEREAILRRAGITLIASTILFTLAAGLFVYEQQVDIAIEATAGASGVNQLLVDETPTLGIQFPPAATMTATPDLALPTPTATSLICRAVVTGTSFGLYLRETPGGEDLDLLPEGELLTLLEDAPVETEEFIWRKVRALGGQEGWVAQEFLEIRAPCQ